MTDSLLSLMPTQADGDRPWLVWYAYGERVELTGRVLAMWQSKISGFLSQELATGARVHLAPPPHWRTVAWCCGTWLAAGSVVLDDDGGPSTDATATRVAPQVSVAFEAGSLDPRAELQVLVARPSLALAWNGELPPLVVDGVADLMAFPDRAEPARCAPGAPALEITGVDLARVLSRQQLVDGLPTAAARATREAGARAVAVEETRVARAVRCVLAAWREGLTAVLLSGELDAAARRTARRQEGALDD